MKPLGDCNVLVGDTMIGQRDMLQTLNILKVACAGAILCSAIVGASFSLIAGAEPSAAAQFIAAITGAVLAGAAKASAFLP